MQSVDKIRINLTIFCKWLQHNCTIIILGCMEMKDMLAPPPVKLPEDPAAAKLAEVAPTNPVFATALKEVATEFPASPLVWALIAEQALTEARGNEGAELRASDYVTAYAYARTGYHRGLDRLRGNGWKGWGPVPLSHEPNQGVLRAIAALAHAAQAIGEDEEYDRLRQMLSDADPDCVATLLDS